jgi:hypothetical protein
MENISNELIKIRRELKVYKAISLISIACFVLIISLGAMLPSVYDVVKAKRFEVVNEKGIVLLSLDANGINNAGNARPFMDYGRIRFTFKKGLTAFRVYDLGGIEVRSVRYSFFNNEIKIDNKIRYSYDPQTGDVLYNDAVFVGNAKNEEQASSLAINHYVNLIFVP